jgi:hypothetical protein
MPAIKISQTQRRGGSVWKVCVPFHNILFSFMQWFGSGSAWDPHSIYYWIRNRIPNADSDPKGVKSAETEAKNETLGQAI